MKNWFPLVKLQDEASNFTKSSTLQLLPNQAKHHIWMHIFFCYKFTLVSARSLYFLTTVLQPNARNKKIPLELRRKLWSSPNITLTITWFSWVAFGICTKPINSAVPNNKNNFMIILWNFSLSFLARRLCFVLFSRLVVMTIIEINKEFPQVIKVSGTMYTASLAWNGNIQQ